MKLKRLLTNLLHPTRIYIISYPKTGRTWLRALIGKAIAERCDLPETEILNTEFMTSGCGLPRTSFTHDGGAMRDRTRYQDLSHDKNKYKHKKVILLGRDVKDTLVSAYFQATKRIGVFDGTISEFIRDDRYGAHKIVTFYRIWSENQAVPEDFLFLRYEDLHADTAKSLKTVLEFLGMSDIDDTVLRSAVEYCSFQNLKKAEAEKRFDAGKLTPGADGDPESFKVRKGLVGNYGEYLSSEDIDYIDKIIKTTGSVFTD